MSIWDKITELYEKKAVKNCYVAVPNSQTDHHANPHVIAPMDGYLRIWLSEMNLAKQRTLFKDRYPAVHSEITLDFAGQKVAFSKVVGPPREQMAGGVVLNYPLTDLIPYNGGIVNLQVVLVALKGNFDLVGTGVKLLENFNDLLNIPLKPAIEVARIVSKGVEDLFRVTDGQPHIYFHQTFSDNVRSATNGLQAGYQVIILTDIDQIDPTQLRVQQDRLFVQVEGEVRPFVAYDYMLLRIEAQRTRDDWKLPIIDQAWKAAQRIISDPTQSSEQRETATQSVALAIMQTEELTRRDKWRVYKAIQKDLERWSNILKASHVRKRRSGSEADESDRQPIGPLSLDDLIGAYSSALDGEVEDREMSLEDMRKF